MIFKYDVNDVMRKIYGADIVNEYLYRDGGKALWNLYFHTAQVHSYIYREFQVELLEERPDTIYKIDPHYLLPCCSFDIKKPEMTEEEADNLIMMKSIIDKETFRNTVFFLNEYCLPKKKREELFEMLIDRYDIYEDDHCLYNAQAVCRTDLTAIYPYVAEEIKSFTTEAVLTYIDLIGTKARMMDKFIKFYKSGCKDITVFFGLELLEFSVRTHIRDQEENISEKMSELLKNLEHDFYQFLPDVDKESDQTELWKAILDFYPDDYLNCMMFKKQMSYRMIDPDQESLGFLEYFMSKTDKLNKIYTQYPETAVTAFMYKKPTLGHKLLDRLGDEPYKEFTLKNGKTYRGKKMYVTRMEVLLLFLNMYPGFEDKKEIMPDDVLEEICRKTLLPVTELATVELIDLLFYSKRYRMKDEDLICWTEAYFEELSNSMA